MKKVSVVVPCFNEEENVEAMSKAIIHEFETYIPECDYEIIFIDNDSRDRTRDIIRVLAASNDHIKGIFNAKNFGQFNSPYYGVMQATGDCAVLMACDFQEPVEMIREFVHAWEEGYKIVCGIKTTSQENKFIYFLRSVYYKLIKKFSQVEMIEQFSGFGLFDRKFIEVMKTLDDPTPFLRGVVAELGFRRKDIEFTQALRAGGKSSNNWYTLYDGAMLSFTSYTKIGLRLATFTGFFGAFVSFVTAVVFFIKKLVNWYEFQAGMAPLIIIMCMLGCLQLLFIGIMGEYILSINTRSMHRPLVIEEERVGKWTPVKTDDKSSEDSNG